MDGLVLCSHMAAGALRGAICLFLVYRLLKEKLPGKKLFLAVSFGNGVLGAVLFLLHGTEAFLIGAEALWLSWSLGRPGTAGIRLRLFISIFYEIAVYFWWFLFSSGFGILFKSEAFLNRELWEGQAAGWAVHVLLLCLAVYIGKKPDITRQEAFRLSSAVVLAGFFAVITLGQQTRLAIPDDTIYMWVILSVILMMSLLVFNISRQYEVEKELSELKSAQAELLERDYTALNEAYEANAKLFHDFHNHMGAVRQLVSHEKYEEALSYLDELQGPVRKMTDTVWIGDEAADYLINSKAEAAAEKGIKFQVQVEYPRRTNIRSADLCAILGNLLDNALEASGKVEEAGERKAALTIRRIHQMLVIKVENSFDGRTERENGELKTTKTEGGLHGWGLKSARTAAEKYDGMVGITCEGNIFCAVATLSYRGIDIK